MSEDEEEEVNQIPVATDEEDDITAARRESARALMEFFVGRMSKAKAAQGALATGRKVIAAAYLLRIPPYDRCDNMMDLAKRIGIHHAAARRLVAQVSVLLCVAPPVEGRCRSHRKR
jgi:hypothetical protein